MQGAGGKSFYTSCHGFGAVRGGYSGGEERSSYRGSGLRGGRSYGAPARGGGWGGGGSVRFCLK